MKSYVTYNMYYQLQNTGVVLQIQQAPITTIVEGTVWWYDIACLLLQVCTPVLLSQCYILHPITLVFLVVAYFYSRYTITWTNSSSM